MKKSNVTSLGTLFLIGIILYPFVWLFEYVSAVEMIIIIAIAVIGYFLFKTASIKQKQENFSALVLDTIHTKRHWKEEKAINTDLSKTNQQEAQFLRSIQIIRDSMEIALTSKKRDTAEARMALVEEHLQNIKNTETQLVTGDVLEEIFLIITHAKKEFHTKLYINVASGHIDKANKLKTKKSKEKYSQLAQDVVMEGIKNGKGDDEIFNYFLEKISKVRADL